MVSCIQGICKNIVHEVIIYSCLYVLFGCCYFWGIFIFGKVVDLQMTTSNIDSFHYAKHPSWVARRLQTFKSYVVRKGKSKQSEYYLRMQ